MPSAADTVTSNSLTRPISSGRRRSSRSNVSSCWCVPLAESTRLTETITISELRSLRILSVQAKPASDSTAAMIRSGVVPIGHVSIRTLRPWYSRLLVTTGSDMP